MVEESEFIHIRVPADYKQKIQDLVTQREHRDITDFVIEAIRDKLEPDRVKSEIKDHLRALIVNDPEIRQLIAGINERK
jgi:Arc/MetJ-type ribon-helix-helix transcriptional regulator